MTVRPKKISHWSWPFAQFYRLSHKSSVETPGDQLWFFRTMFRCFDVKVGRCCLFIVFAKCRPATTRVINPSRPGRRCHSVTKLLVVAFFNGSCIRIYVILAFLCARLCLIPVIFVKIPKAVTQPFNQAQISFKSSNISISERSR